MKTNSLLMKSTAMLLLFVMAATVFRVWYKYNMYTHYQQSAYPRRLGDFHSSQKQQLKVHPTKLPLSKDVIVRSAYFDDRPRNGHDIIGVFLVAVKQSVIDSKLIRGCGVGEEVSSNFKVLFLEENRLMHQWLYVQSDFPHFIYEEYIIECYDIPMTNGSNAFVLFKSSNNSLIHMATSEFPLIFPASRVQPTGPGKFDFSVVTCTEAHNKKVAWLREFIRYQKTIGVDHIHVNILDTFVNDGGLDALLKDSQVAEGVTNGYVTMTVWRDIIETSSKVYSYSAILRKLDCIYRFRGTYDYAFLLDSDDFFNPLEHEKRYLKDYIKNWCRGDKSAGSCYFNWYYYYPDDCGLKGEAPEDGNLTTQLKSYKRWENDHFKSVHLISAVVDTGYHHAICNGCLLPGYRAVHIDPRKAFVAHLRKYAQSPNGC